MGGKRNFFRGNVINTFIGGIGATTTTETALATLLGISVSDITNFSIDGSNNISCAISTNYTLPDSVFNLNTEITYFEDIDGKINVAAGTDHFSGCSNIVYIKINGNFTGDIVVKNCVLLEYVEYPNHTGTIELRQCPIATRMYSPLATSISNFGFYQSYLLKYVNFDNITTIGTSSLEDADSIEYFNLNNADINIAASLTGLTGVDKVVEAVNQVTLDTPMTRFTTSIKKAFFHSVTQHQLTPNNDGAPLHYVISGATTIGSLAQDYSVVSNNFLDWTGTGKVYVHNSMATINGGSPSADMALLTSIGFTVVYVTDYTVPSAISDLSSSNITANTVDLNFSIPATTNSIQHYDVYVDMDDERGYILLTANEITVTGDTISGLPSGANIKIKVRTIDEFYNRSVFSNEITFTTL